MFERLRAGFAAAADESSVITLLSDPRVAKVDLPSGASVNQDSSDRLTAMSRVGSSLPAIGLRPDPGVLPNAAQEADADPIRFALRWGTNVSYTPRSGYGTPFTMLRQLAAVAPVIALCIQCRKDQMVALDWDFAHRDKKAKGPDIDAKIARARQLFAKPDGVTPFESWLQMLVDECLTVDAVSIYKRPTVSGKPYDSGAKFVYDIIDGTTIKVLLDNTGSVPRPPDIAYRQIIYGVPVQGGDCTADELLYRPKTVRTWTPYGLSPIENCLLLAIAGLNRDMFSLSYYTEGNIPEALAGVPDSWSPKVIKQWQEYWDLLLRGDPKNRSRLRFVVQSMAKNIHEFRKPDFTTTYDLWLLKMQCACFGVTPSEIGFTDDVNKATSKSQGDVNQRRGVKPMARFLARVQNELLALEGLGDLEAVWSGGEGEDALTQAKIRQLQLQTGEKSLDEIRAANGDPTIGAGPAVLTATGPVFWEDVIAASEATGITNTGGDDDPDIELPPATALDDTDPSQADLKKYRRMALKAVEKGRAPRPFRSRVLAPALLQKLQTALARVTTADAVKTVFAPVLKAQRLNALQRKHQAQMRSTLTTVLADAGSAFAAHMAAGVTELEA